MSFPVAVQLYSVRDAMAEDFEGTIKKVKEMGYDGVEFAGLFGKKPADIKALLDESVIGQDEAKKVLAFEVTKLVHGEEEAKKAADAAASLFGGAMNSANIPTYAVPAEEMNDLRVTTLLTKAKLTKSNSEARKQIEAGAVAVNDEKVTDVNMVLTAEQLDGDGAMIRKGKKSYVRIVKQ